VRLGEAYSALGYGDYSALKEEWRAARGYDAFEAEKFNKRILSSLNAIEADLVPIDGLYVCPFCDKVSFKPQKRDEDVFFTCSSCGSTIELNDEVWEYPRKRIEYLSFTSGYPGAYILHHFIVLQGNRSAQPAIRNPEVKRLEENIHCLSSPDEEERYRAARYLRLRRPIQAFESVVAVLGSEPSARIRVMLVHALPSIGGRDAIPHLIAAREDSDPAVRNAALQALSSFEDTVVDRTAGHATGDR